MVGSYDNITGSNNFVFASNYTGSGEGDLIVESWKVQLDKRSLVMVMPIMVVSVLTLDEATFYRGYVKNFQPTKTNTLCVVSEVLQTAISATVSAQASESISASSGSLLPNIVTPLLGSSISQTTQNLRTESTPTVVNQPSSTATTNQPVNLSLSLLNKSWLPF